MKPRDEVPLTQAQTRPANSSHSAQSASTLWGSLTWWPTLVAVGLAGFIALDMSRGIELAPILAASGLVYLGAAALRKPSAAWPVFLGTFVVITIAKFGVLGVNATWVFLGLGAVFVGYGFLRRAAHPIHGLPLQTIAMVGFGATAAIALIVGGKVGAYLVAAGLLGHAAWDIYHHRGNKVVVRSMAEFCCVLDTLLAIAIVIAAVRD